MTARKRDEAALDVPVAISAFNSKEIESAGILRPQDFIQLTPNMTMVQTQNQGTSFIVVRGISQARNSEPSVAVLIDGVLMANPSQFNQELYDISSIEVLKGPQGALYGRNAIGGAIIINTKEPGDHIEGKVMAGYDSVRVTRRGSRRRPDGNSEHGFPAVDFDASQKPARRRRLTVRTFRAGQRREPNVRSRQTEGFVLDVTQALYLSSPGKSRAHLPRASAARYPASATCSMRVAQGRRGPGGRHLASTAAYDDLQELLLTTIRFLPIVESALYTIRFAVTSPAPAHCRLGPVFTPRLRTNRLRWIAGA